MNIKQQTRQQPIRNKKLGISNKLNIVNDYVICEGAETKKNKNCEDKKKIINKTELDKIIVEDDKTDNIIVENDTIKELQTNDKTDNIKKTDSVKKLSYDLSIKKLLSRTGKITLNYDCVNYNGKDYVVFKINTSMNVNNLVVIDADDFDKIKYLTWHIKKDGYICAQISKGSKLYLHCLIMGRTSYEDSKLATSIDHINRVKTDTRKENLRFATNTEQHKNQKKRIRDVKLPECCNIDKNDIPKCVSYMPPHKGNSDGFRIYIENFNGKPLEYNASRKSDASLEFKLEHAKCYLQYLKNKYPDEFDKHYIEYDYSLKDFILIVSHNAIIKLGKFPEYKDCLVKYNTKNYIESDFTYLSTNEIYSLKNNFDPENSTGKTIISNLPNGCGITPNMIPECCHFTIGKEIPAGKFRIEGHPGLSNSCWDTTSKRNVTIQIKFQDMKEMYNILNKLPKGCQYSKETIEKKINYSKIRIKATKIPEKFLINTHPKMINGMWSTLNTQATRQEKLNELLEMYNIINKLPDCCYYNAGVHSFEIIDHPKLEVKNKIIKIGNNLINNKFSELQELLLNLELL